MKRKNTLKEYYLNVGGEQVMFVEYTDMEDRPGEWGLVNGESEFFPFKAVPNEPFKAFLKIIDTRKGRSAMNFRLRDPSTGRVYWGGLSCFHQMLNKGITENGCEATWQVFKRGSNYLLDIVE